MALFGDSITTDHISPPARSTSEASPAGQNLLAEASSQGRLQQLRLAAAATTMMMTRRHLRQRAHQKQKDLPAAAEEGGVTRCTMPTGEKLFIYDAP